MNDSLATCKLAYREKIPCDEELQGAQNAAPVYTTRIHGPT